MKKQKKYGAKIRRPETEAATKTTKPLRRKEVEMQLRNGNLTKEQAIELRQRYMDSLEYNEDQQFVTMCGGIKPLPSLKNPCFERKCK